MATEPIQIHTALLSVSDKTDLVPFARKLHGLGVTIISTGGTRAALTEADLPTVGIETLTGFPEMMDGRVKTLHPKVHGGLLALRDKPDHAASLAEHGITPIDLVCVNLYPFEQAAARQTADGGVGDDDVIENIDIGGPSMIRSAAKNHRYVTVVTTPRQYDAVSNEMERNHGATTLGLRRQLAAAAFERTSVYDTAIAAWMSARFKTAPAPTEKGTG